MIRKAWPGLVGVLTLVLWPTAAAPVSGTELLRGSIDQILRGVEGEMGVVVKHIESGGEVAVQGDEPFPMASTFKLAVLVELFGQVDAGKIRLDERVELAPEHLHLGSGTLKDFLVPGVALSVENLALMMMRISDNSATDLLLGRVGRENVNQRLARLAIEGMSVDRNC
jgi:beta-lactamase class A